MTKRDADARPTIVQHYAGAPGAGGPQGVVKRVMSSRLAEIYKFLPMHQTVATGGLNHRMIYRWAGMIRAVKPDLVHVRGLQNEGFQAVMAARLAGCRKVLVTVHGSVRDLQFTGRSVRRTMLEVFAEPATLRLASHVGSVCNFGAEREFMSAHSAKFWGVIPNGVAIPVRAGDVRDKVRRELGITAVRPVMICVSRLTWEKGYRTLAQALLHLPRSTVKPVLLVIGDGPDRSDIESALANMALVDVRFLGRRNDVSRLLAAADLFIFPTLHENLSNALLEAMAQGLPVIASEVGGNVEVLEKGGGILLSPTDVDSWTHAIADLLADPARRRALGEAARTVVSSDYSEEAMLGRLDRCYADIIGNAPKLN